MKLNKKIVTIIITLITIALVGLVCLQIFILNRAVQLELQTFRQNVNSALNSVVQKLEVLETKNKTVKIVYSLNNKSGKNTTICDSTLFNNVTVFRNKTPDSCNIFPPFKIDSNKIFYHVEGPLNILDSLNSDNKVVDTLKHKKLFRTEFANFPPGNRNVNVNLASDSTAYFIQVNSSQISDSALNRIPMVERQVLINKILDEMVVKVDINDRIQPSILDSIVDI